MSDTEPGSFISAIVAALGAGGAIGTIAQAWATKKIQDRKDRVRASRETKDVAHEETERHRINADARKNEESLLYDLHKDCLELVKEQNRKIDKINEKYAHKISLRETDIQMLMASLARSDASFVHLEDKLEWTTNQLQISNNRIAKLEGRAPESLTPPKSDSAPTAKGHTR